MNREDSKRAVKDRTTPWDVVVIGGGATGAGCCLDAAARGLSVLLVEQDDFGKGTSSRSTKLVHGGVRYLEQGNISLVREALRERGLLRLNAPGQVVAREFIVPCYSLWERIYYTAGLKIYDLFAGKLSFGRSTSISGKAVTEAMPNVKRDGLRGGVKYFDGQFDDTRLLLAILETAAKHGGVVLNYAKVDKLSKNASGRINGVSFLCSESGERFNVYAKTVINATGAFADSMRKLSDAQSKPMLSPSRGIHLVFDKQLLNSEAALMIPKTTDGRVLFAIPFYGRTIVGTTDTPVEHAELDPVPAAEEIDFILGNCALYFENPPRREDIKSVFAGIRPLIQEDSAANTASLSRGHTIKIDESGLITIAGGKWTTYRNMAEDTVDQALKSAGMVHVESVTSGLALVGQEEFDELGLDRKLSEDFDWNMADVVRSVRFEMARTVEDVLARRTRLLVLDAEEAVRVAPLVAEVMASELGYGKDWIESQLREFMETAQKYRVHKDTVRD